MILVIWKGLELKIENKDQKCVVFTQFKDAWFDWTQTYFSSANNSIQYSSEPISISQVRAPIE